MSNDYVDIAAARTSRVDGAGARTWRVSLFSQVALACVWGRPSLEVMGLRLWLLCERLIPGVLPKTKAAMRKALQGVEREAFAVLQVMPEETSPEDRGRVVDLLLGGLSDPRRMGRRVSLLAYAFDRSPERKLALPSFEVIGQVWGLTATNKRSAVQAAMKKLVRAMVERGHLNHVEATRLMTELWYEKKPATKVKYAAAQAGNTNKVDGGRLAVGGGQGAVDGRRWTVGGAEGLPTDHGSPATEGDEPECVRHERMREHAELVRGVPASALRKEFQGLSQAEIRKRLNALHEAAEKRRLGLG